MPNSISEDFSVTTSGDDILWECPALIATSGEYYEMFYRITSASVWVEYIGIPFGPVDVTDMIPPENIVTWQPESGPPPLNFMWHEIVTPADQDPPSLAFDWIVDIDAGGNGAPLMPLLDWILFNNSSYDQIILNIGGYYLP